MSGILTKLAKASSTPAKREANLKKFLKPSVEKGRLYHGTTSADELTETADQPISQFTTSPTWLAKEPTTANRYAAAKGHDKGAVYPVFAQIRNPLKMQFDADDRADKALALAARIGADVDYIKGMSEPLFAWEVINHPHFIDKARAAGYDGFAVNESGQMTYGVFDPSKIKSAIGNRGTFSTKTPELSKAGGGLMEHLDPGYEAESIRRFMDEERKKKVDQPSGGAAFGIYPSSGKGRKYGPVSRALDTGEAQAAAAKGLTMMPQNLAGMPVDLINLALSPLGLASEKPVMGSDWLKEQSRKAGLAFAEPQDPTLKGFFTAGDIASNLINPAAATRSVASGAGRVAGAVAPKAAEMAEGYLQASGLAPTVVKSKGGNWITGPVTGSIERGIEPLMTRGLTPERVAELEALPRPNTAARALMLQPEDPALNNWIEKKLNKYIRNEMGTPEDPVRSLAERGILHYRPQFIDEALEVPRGVQIRRQAGQYPKEGLGQSRLAQEWEIASDFQIIQEDARTRKALMGEDPYRQQFAQNPWISKVDPETPIYEVNMPSNLPRDLGFDHLIDELRNAIRPDSDLPARLRWKPEDLQKVTMEQAVRRVHDINEYRAAKKAEANEVLARNPATAPYRDYDTVPGTDQPNEKGLSWKQIKAPDMPAQLPEGWTMLEPKGGVIRASSQDGARALGNDIPDLIKSIYNRHPETPGNPKTALEDALKYEGDVMGHCVGGYCNDVLSGRSQIFSLRDKKGEPHVTIETGPAQAISYPHEMQAIYDKVAAEANAKNFDTHDEWKSFYFPRVEELHMQMLAEKAKNMPPAIIQIKGKGNRAPNAEYLPFVQDFVRSGNWSRVGDFSNTGLFRKIDFIDEFTPAQLDSIGKGEYLTMNEIKKLREGKNWKPIDTDPDLDVDFNLLRAKGGEVHAAGGGLMEYLDPGYEAEVIRRKGDTALDLPTTNLTPQERDLAPRRRPVPEAPLAEAKPISQSLRQSHANALQDLLKQKGGLDNYAAARISQTLLGGPQSGLPLGLGVSDIPIFTPYAGEDLGFMMGEAGSALRHGDIGEAALKGGLSALYVAPAARPAVGAVKAAGRNLAPKVGQMAEGYLQSTGLAPSIVAKPNRFGFFSAAEEAALTTPRKSGPGQGFLNDLRKAGVSKNELEPTGIAEFLQSSPNVTREEVQQFVKQNKPDVQVKVLSDPTQHPNQEILNQYGLQYDHILDQITPLDRPIGELKSGEAPIFTRWYEKEYMDDPKYADWVRQMEDLGQEIYSSQPKFATADLSLPGGDNYREMLLKLPPARATEGDQQKLKEIRKRILELQPIVDKQPIGITPERKEFNDLYQQNQQLSQRLRGEVYTSPHWSDPNVITHIRMNDRVDADGKKVLFIEELQSDWGQEGKRRGFQTKEFKKAEKEFNEYSQQLADKYGLNPKHNLAMYATMKGMSPEEVKAYEDLQQKYMSSKGVISEAPFVTKTNDWVDLGLKHILKTAANEGYDRVAFINGTQSADRYDLSKRVDQLLYKKNDDGTYKISAQAGGRGNMIGERISEDKLADYVGKDVADKIVSDTGVRINLGGSSVSQPEDMWGSLSGEGLKVGGEGMKNFYDKIVPGQVNALLKKFGGGKLGDIQIPTEGGVLTQPGFDITPELRKKLAEPMSYAEGGAVNMADTIAQQLQSSGMDADKALMHALRMQAAKDAEPVTVAQRPEIDGAEDFKQAVMQKFAAGGIAKIGKALAGKGGKKEAEKAGASILQTRAPEEQSVIDKFGQKQTQEAARAKKVEKMAAQEPTEPAKPAKSRRPRAKVEPDIYRKMAAEQGDEAVLRAARAGEHLKPTPGGYVGAPRTVTSGQGLGAMRRSMDKDFADSVEAVRLADPERLGTWYDRAKRGIAESNEPYQIDRSLEQHGVYSAGVSPESELAFALKHLNSRVAGEPSMAYRGAPMRNLDTAVAENRPANMGFKIGEYANKNDPRIPNEGLFGVNDFRRAQGMGYTDPQGNPWKAGVSETMHPFMDAETALQVDRANKAGIGGRTDWAGPHIQEVPWVYGKAQDLYALSKEGRFKGDELEGIKGALQQANNTARDYFYKHAASATHEAVPGARLGHVPQVLKMGPAEKLEYGRTGRWDMPPPEYALGEYPQVGAGNRDIIYGAAGYRQLPSREASGLYINSLGGVETNPMTIARPLMDYPTGGGGLMAPESRRMADTLEQFRAFIDAQEAGAYNLPNTMAATKGKNSMVFDTRGRNPDKLGDPSAGVLPTSQQLSDINDAIMRHTPVGPDGTKNPQFTASATNRGVVVFPYDPSMSSKDASKFLNKVKKDIVQIYPSDVQKSMTTTGYVPGIGKRSKEGPLSTAPYSGEAISDLLRAFADLPQSVAMNIGESEAIREAIRQKALRDSLMGGTRGDIQESRRFFSEADWPKAVEMIRKGMSPAAALAALGYSASSMAGERQ